MHKKDILLSLNQYILNTQLFCKTTRHDPQEEWKEYDKSNINIKKQVFNFQLGQDDSGNLYIQDAYFVDQTAGYIVSTQSGSKVFGNDFKTYEFFEKFNPSTLPLTEMSYEQIVHLDISFSLADLPV